MCKKFFNGNGLVCKFCNQKAHTFEFCPSRPTEPPKEELVPFVENLLRMPMLKPKKLIGLNWEEALRLVTAEGERLNVGNPWLHDDGPGAALRKGLGFWKAIGASHSILSWIGYGFEFRFIRQPKRFLFVNIRSCAASPGAEDFVDKEIATHVEDGVFSETSKRNVHVCNPIQVEPKGVDEFRN